MEITKQQHKSIDDANLHNPKGFSSASNSTILSKNENGSLQWIRGDNNLTLTINPYYPTVGAYKFQTGRKAGFRSIATSGYMGYNYGYEDQIAYYINLFKPAVGGQVIRCTSYHTIKITDTTTPAALYKYCDWILTYIFKYQSSSYILAEEVKSEFYGDTLDFSTNFSMEINTFSNKFLFHVDIPDTMSVDNPHYYYRQLYFQYI